MKKIKSLHNIHRSTPIWIVGSGPSLDSYPANFIDDKIGITLHMAYLKFPNTTYMYANESDRVEYLKNNHPDYRNVKHIYGYPFYGLSKKESRDLVTDIPEVYQFQLRPYPPFGIRGVVDWGFTHKKVCQARMGSANVFGGHGTCLHGAFYSAVMLGGNPINLIGAGHGMYRGNEHFNGIVDIDKEMRPSAPSFSDPNNNVPIIEQTMAIIEACRKEGIEVKWIKEYRSSGDYEVYNYSDEDLALMKVNYIRKYSHWQKLKNSIKKIYNPVINSW